MTLILEEFREVDQIPADFDPLFETAGKRTVFLTKDWFSLLASDAIPEDSQPQIFTARDKDGTPLVVLPCLKTGGSLSGFSNYYSHGFAPLLHPTADDPTHVKALGEIATLIAASPTPSVVLKPFAPDDPAIALTEQAFETTGFKTDRFHAGTRRFINTAGLSGADYENQLPSRLTNTIQRRQKADQYRHRFEVFSAPADVPQAVELYQKVYASSWKPPEPMPGFIPGFASLLASQGSLRLGVWFVDDEAVAAQLWIVENHRASIFKLAHNSASEDLSVGTALTLKMFQSVLDNDQPERIDFGIGEEPFKTAWTPNSETLIGLVAFNRRSVIGRLQHLRHAAGQLIKRTGRFSESVQESNDGKAEVPPR